MDFDSIVQTRFSCRKFTSQNVTKEQFQTLFNTVRCAPSAVNFQPWHFIIGTSPEVLAQIHECYDRDWIQAAPAIIVACANHEVSWKRADGKDHADIDVSIAIDHLTLKATEMGLGTCWVCKFDVERCVKAFNLPAHLEPVALVPIGFPAKETDIMRHEQQRKSVDEIISFNQL